MRYRVNQPRIIHETIDGETVIVDLSNGTYYSIEGPGVEILELLAAGAAPGTVVDHLSVRWDGSRAAMERAVSDFAAELTQAEILVAEPANDGNNGRHHAPALAASTGIPRLPFTAPVLNRYSDMQELLLVDPIHEVGEAGWPEPKPDNTAPGR